jgi:hypothetical protein
LHDLLVLWDMMQPGKERREKEVPPGKRVREGLRKYQEVQPPPAQGGAVSQPWIKSRPVVLPWRATSREAWNAGSLRRRHGEERCPVLAPNLDRQGSHGRPLLQEG